MVAKLKKQISGFSLVELLVAVAVFAILASGVTYVVINSYRNFFGGGDRQTVVQFAQEGMEAVKSIRDNSWQAFVAVSGAGNKGVVKNSSGLWEYSGTSNTLGALTRTIAVTDVQRNTSYNIVASGGTNDPDTKKVTVTVSGFGISNYVLSSYLTNWSSKAWSQTDWSSTDQRQFWTGLNMAYTSENINQSTVGELKLSQISGTEMSWSGWSDIVSDQRAKYGASEDFYNMFFGPDSKSLYLVGNTNYGFIKYDISRAQADILQPEWKKSLTENMGSGAINPNGNYAYLSVRLPSDDDEDGLVKMICKADLNTLASIDMDSDCYNLSVPGEIPWAGTWYINSMVVNAAGSRLYSFDNQGIAYTFSISGGGATLALLNAQLLSSATSTANAINQTYLDESGATTYVDLVSDDNNGEFRKFSLNQNTGEFTQIYADSSPTADYNDIEFLETSSGKNRFILGTEDSAKEFMIVEDQGSSLSTVGSYDVPTSRSYAEVTSDGANMAFLHYYSPGEIYAIDITDRAHPANGNMTNTTFIRRSHYYTYNQMLYSTSSHGFFVSDRKADAKVDLHFIGRDFTRATGGTFAYKRAITVGLGSTVSSGPHTDFPVVISETQDYLKSVANGGKVYSADGYDIIFTSDSAGTTVLDHEIEKYNPSTGELVVWVKIPSLAANTTIYMFYGNSNITSTQEHVDGVWSNGYQLVTHMADTNFGGVGDSVFGSNGWFKSNVGYPAESSGKVGPGEYFDGSYSILQIENNADKDQSTSDFTVEFWVKPSSSGTVTYSAPVYFGNGDIGLLDGWLFRHYTGTTKKLYFHMGDSGTTNLGGVSTNDALTDNVWTHVAMTVDRDWGYQYYINAATDGSCTDAPCNSTAAYSVGETYNAMLGRDLSMGTYFKGDLDELRISLTPRSQGWITTGYNNMNSPATFYSIGTESAASGYQSPGYLYSSIYDLGTSDKELRSVTVEQNVPSGCGLSVTLQADNTSAFSSAVSEVFSNTGSSLYTSSTPLTLNNKRYLRYRVDMTSCSDSTQTPVLYSLKFTFK